MRHGSRPAYGWELVRGSSRSTANAGEGTPVGVIEGVAGEWWASIPPTSTVKIRALSWL
jgi:hypothetical protein